MTPSLVRSIFQSHSSGWIWHSHRSPNIISVEENIIIDGSPIALQGWTHPHIRVCWAQCETQEVHARSKVIAEVSSCGLPTIECTVDEGNLTLILQSKLGTANDEILAGAWGLEVGISDVSRKDVNSIQGGTSQSNPDTLP